MPIFNLEGVMKILVYSSGVIGTTYGWQSPRIGHEAAMFVCPGNRKKIEDKGFQIHCQT